MATYFLDTSAIVKRYILEQGQSLLLDICNPDNDLYISQASLVEVVATKVSQWMSEIESLMFFGKIRAKVTAFDSSQPKHIHSRAIYAVLIGYVLTMLFS